MTWTADRVIQLTHLWKQGISAREISYQMQGLTRNAVIGKVHRLGLPGRITVTSTARQYKSAPPKRKSRKGKSGHPPARRGGQRTAVKPSPVYLPDFIGPLFRPTILQVRDGMCRYMVDDRHCCGIPTCNRDTGVWCAGHADVVFQP